MTNSTGRNEKSAFGGASGGHTEDANDFLFSLEDILDGMPSKRANTLLYLIESRVAQQLIQARLAGRDYSAAQPETFYEAFDALDELHVQPTIQDIERLSSSWARLVPETPRLRAALARAMAEKYGLAYRAVPRIRERLGLDTDEVHAAYMKLYSAPLATIYTSQLTLAQRWRWLWSSVTGVVDHLPPFWLTFLLAVTQTIGASLLALPIALAGMGALPGLVLIIVIGVIAMLTAGYMTEAMVRNGAMRFQGAYLGRVVAEYLGPSGSLVLTFGVALAALLGLLAYYLGFGAALADALNTTPIVGLTLIFAVNLVFLVRGGFGSTLASTLMIGLINLVIIVLFMALSITHLNLDYLTYTNVPFVNNGSFDQRVLGLAFGVITGVFVVHLYISNSARLILERDPSGRALVRGSSAGILASIFLVGAWHLAISGIIAPQVLSVQTGTVIAPMAVLLGPGVNVLGLVLIILAMVTHSIHASTALYNLMRERLPKPRLPEVILTRRDGVLRLEQRDDPEKGLRIGVFYQGYEARQPVLRFEIQEGDQRRQLELRSKERITEAELGTALPLTVYIDAHTAEQITLRVESALRIGVEGRIDISGLTLADALELPPELTQILTWMMTEDRVRVGDVAARFGYEYPVAARLLELLEEQDFVRRRDGVYEVRLAARAGSDSVLLWQLLEEEDAAPVVESGLVEKETRLVRMRRALLTGRGAVLVCLLPLLFVFGFAFYSLLTEQGTFTDALSFRGVVANAIFAGVFPPLLLIASRRKGELLPGQAYRLFHPVLAVGIIVFFLVAILLHGVLIWRNPVQQAGALIVVGVVLVLFVTLLQRRAFARRRVLEVRELLDEARTAVTMVSSGRPLETKFHTREQSIVGTSGELPALHTMQSFSVDVPTDGTRELKVWVHRFSPDATSTAELPAITVEVTRASGSSRFDLRSSGGQLLVEDAQRITFHLDEA
ncbi:MAG: hypothetical protein OHK0046_42760 [Anaerolineae bacterium]